MDDLADTQECEAHEDGLSPPDEIAPKDRQHGADEAADVPCCHGDSLKCGGVEACRIGDGIDARELRAEFREDEEAGKVTLVVAEEAIVCGVSTISGEMVAVCTGFTHKKARPATAPTAICNFEPRSPP